MNRHIPQGLLDYLIDIGECERFELCLEIPERFPEFRSGQFMRMHFSAWYEVAAFLESSKLASLIKTLTIAEARVPNFRAGSVSPVIWLFRKLSERDFAGLEELADWVLAHSTNEYLPTGSYNYQARSMADLGHKMSENAQRKHDRQITESIRQAEVSKTKADKATLKLAGALRRRDLKAVEALLQQGADIDAIDQDGSIARETVESLGLVHLLNIKESMGNGPSFD
jgi:hypothetical protein